jgi:VanZ family protein
VAVGLWFGVIFYFSDQPDLKSSLPSVWDLVFRKIAHVAEFFVLMHLILRALSVRRPTRNQLIMAFCLVLLTAAFDEWHQNWVAGRVGSVKDIGVDMLGPLAYLGLQRIRL